MRCPRCQAENLAGQKFCGECGARLASVCPTCGAANTPCQKFCGEWGAPLTQAAATAKFGSPESYTPRHLAEKILTSKSALEGERKQVAVLFVDVSGFTALSERLDPEDVHQRMTRAFELMLAQVHRYEGTVNWLLDDGIMALCGAPIAHAIRNPTQPWKTHLALGGLRGERKDLDAARQAYHAAREVIDGIKASLRDPALRSSLESAPAIRHVYDLAASS